MSETLKVTLEKPDGTVAILRTDGYINNTGGEEIARQAYTLLGEGTVRLLLDLEKTWSLVLTGILQPDRADYFSQFVRRRTALAISTRLGGVGSN